MLTESQRVKMLRATLLDLGAVGVDQAAIAAAAAGLGGVTPGDFAAVARRFLALDVQPAVGELAEALRGELAFRTPGRKAAGFFA